MGTQDSNETQNFWPTKRQVHSFLKKNTILVPTHVSFNHFSFYTQLKCGVFKYRY